MFSARRCSREYPPTRPELCPPKNSSRVSSTPSDEFVCLGRVWSFERRLPFAGSGLALCSEWLRMWGLVFVCLMFLTR